MELNEIVKKLDGIEDLPTLPSVASEVNGLVHEPDSSVRNLSAAIEKDQAMTAKILKLVNAAFFGLPSRVGNIPHALVLLGFNTVRNAVLSVSVIRAFSPKRSVEGFDIREFWRHSISVAVTSRFLAEKTRLYPVDDSFTAGLLHDIGKFVLSQHFPDSFCRVLVAAARDGITFSEAEKREIPLDHAGIGAYLGSRWKLPSSLVEAIHHHHESTDHIAGQNLLTLVHTADRIVNREWNGRSEPFIQSPDPAALGKLAPLVATVSQWYPQVQEEAEVACNFFLEEVG